MKLRTVLVIIAVVLLLGSAGVWAYETLVYMEQGGGKLVIASGGEIEIQSGGIFDMQSNMVVAVPTAQGTATPGLYIDNLSVADSLVFADGGSVVGIIQDDGFLNWEAGANISGNVATTGTLAVTGLSTLSGGESIPYGVENLRQTSVFSNTVTQTGAGGTVVLATVGAGEIWVVHDILVHCTTEYDDTSGDDEAIEIGTGEDEDGFCVLGTDELIPTYAAATGFAEGWSCNSVQDRGVFFDEAATNSWVGGFIIESTETIDVKVSSGAGDDITQGSIDVYVIYTRLE